MANTLSGLPDPNGGTTSNQATAAQIAASNAQVAAASRFGNSNVAGAFDLGAAAPAAPILPAPPAVPIDPNAPRGMFRGAQVPAAPIAPVVPPVAAAVQGLPAFNFSAPAGVGGVASAAPALPSAPVPAAVPAANVTNPLPGLPGAGTGVAAGLPTGALPSAGNGTIAGTQVSGDAPIEVVRGSQVSYVNPDGSAYQPPGSSGPGGLVNPSGAITSGFGQQDARAQGYIQQALNYVQGGADQYERASRGRTIAAILNASVGPNNQGGVAGQGADSYDNALAGIQQAGIGAGAQLGSAGINNAGAFSRAQLQTQSAQAITDEDLTRPQPTGQGTRLNPTTGIYENFTTYGLPTVRKGVGIVGNTPIPSTSALYKPTLDEYLERNRPLNPGVSDAQLTAAYKNNPNYK